MKNYIITRFKEPSTYRGIVMCLTSFGIFISPEQIEAITFIGLFIVGVLGAATPDKDSDLHDT